MLAEKPWRAEATIRLFLMIFFCVCVGLLVADAVQKQGGSKIGDISFVRIVITTLSFQGMALILVAFFVRRHRISWKEAFGITVRPWGKPIMIGILAAAIFLPIGLGLQWLSTSVLGQFKMTAVEQQPVQAIRQAETLFSQVYLGVFAVVIAPVMEELLFRGILYPAIKQAGFPRMAFFGTAILFGAIHSNAATFLPLTVFAFVLTVLYERTGNLLTSIATHSAFNLINLIFLYTSRYFQG